MLRTLSVCLVAAAAVSVTAVTPESDYQCPPQYPHLRHWQNDPQHWIWCYAEEVGTGPGCNIITSDVAPPEGSGWGFNANKVACEELPTVYSCPHDYPYLRASPGDNPDGASWCYENADATGASCNIQTTIPAAEGASYGHDASLPDCEDTSTYSCPEEFPHMRRWQNAADQTYVWCYKHEHGTGSGCNIVTSVGPPPGLDWGYNANMDTCDHFTAPKAEYSCPPEFPFLRHWKNDPGTPLWCYKNENGQGQGCNIKNVPAPPRGTFGVSAAMDDCPTSSYSCPADKPHLRHYQNNPSNTMWCYKSERGVGSSANACNVPSSATAPASGPGYGYNANMQFCNQECTHTTCDVAGGKIVTSHSKEEQRCHRFTDWGHPDGGFVERAVSNKGMHCALVDRTDSTSCKCFTAGNHPRGPTPARPEPAAPTTTTTEAPVDAVGLPPLDINQAAAVCDIDALDQIRTITATRAQALCDLYAADGPFTSIFQIKSISGVSTNTVRNMVLKGGLPEPQRTMARYRVPCVAAPSTTPDGETEDACSADATGETAVLMALDINMAAEECDIDALDQLRSVTAAKAQVICDLYAASGPFTSVYDLSGVSGVSTATVDTMQEKGGLVDGKFRVPCVAAPSTTPAGKSETACGAL